ncbi:DUF11 domain-containing protein, partial [Flavobacterium sp.]|uniref:DUF11 domain-containing protein n=1 Tax=Flavobacterium sp. TaxID=239 RepID=UPI00261664FE
MKTINKYSFILSLITILFTSKSFAEGTPTLSPNAANITAVLSAPDLQSGSFYNCSEDNRIYFNIANAATERLYFGFDFRQYAVGAVPRLNNVYYRIRRPDGTVAVTALWNSTLGSAGSIDTHARALIGPNIGSVTTGYSPLTFNPTVTGEHWIEIYRSNDGGVTPLTTNADRAVAALFDMTVATTAGVRRNGRVHSDKWGLVAVDTNYGNLVTASSEPNFYVYTADQVVLFIDFRPGFQPIAYNLAVNSYGVNPVGAFNITRRSINSLTAPALANGFKIFLNLPDSTLYPTAAIPSPPTFLNPAISGCGPYNIGYNISQPGDVRLVIDLNGVPGFQLGSSDRLIEAFGVLAGNNTLSWDGLDGLGNPVADGSSMTLTLFYLAGRYNMPLHDAELNKNGFNVQSIAPVAIANSQMYWDDTQLTNVGTTCATDGSTQENNLTGSGINNTITGTPSPARAWSGNSNASQTIPAPAVGTNETDGITCNDYGNVRVLNTYGWGLSSSSVTTTIFKGCSDLRVVKTVNNATPNVGSQVTFTITASNLGGSNDTNVVVNDVLPAGYTLVGTPVASTGTWSNPNWTIGNFASGASATLTITATVNASGPYLNTACINGDNTDPVSGNDCSSVSTTPVPVTDLTVLKSISPLNFSVNSTVTFTITATNNGPSNATNVVVTDALPVGFTLSSATPSTGTWTNPNWNIGNLASGATANLVVTAVANPNYSTLADYTNTACISGTQLESNNTNNCSSVTRVPNPIIDLAIVKTATPLNPIIGTNVTFNLLVTNNGPSNTLGTFTANDLLPTGAYTFVSATPSIGTYNSTTGVWTITGGLTTGSSATLSIVATVNPTSNNNNYNNTATVFIYEVDPNPANNTSSINPLPLNAPIDARDDFGVLVNGYTGGVSVANVLANDFLNGSVATLSTVTITQISSSNSGISVNPLTGAVNVAPGTPAGTYTLTYRICEVLNPSNCDNAIVTVPVGVAPI